MNKFQFRRFSSLLESTVEGSIDLKPEHFHRRKWNPLPIPHRSIPDPNGQDLDFVSVAHSHLIHYDWNKLDTTSTNLTPFRVKHVLLKIKKDYVLSLEFFKWVETRNPNLHTLESHAIILHILAKNRKFKSAESILRSILEKGSIELPGKLFDAILYSYRICDSSPCVFDALFKTYAHLKNFRNATDTFCMMKEYGFLPTIESCNAFLSALLDKERVDIIFSFYREMRRSRISPNVYTLNMVMSAYCKSGKLEKAVELFKDLERFGLSPSVASFNTLIAGHCTKALLGLAVKLKDNIVASGLQPNAVTFNTLISGFCKEGKLEEANKMFAEMKFMKVAPNTVTYNTLLNGYSSQVGNSEIASRLFDEMSSGGVKADILTYNALILGLCKDGKTKKAAYLVKQLDKENLVPNASTFAALIIGQCVRNNPERAVQLYESMKRAGFHPNSHTLNVLMHSFCKVGDFEGAVEVLRETIHRALAVDSNILADIFHELCRHGRDQLAMKLYGEMETKFLLPKDFNWDLICRTASSKKVLDDGILYS